MAEAQEWRRHYTPPTALQGEIRDATTANYFLFFPFPELSGMLYCLLFLLSCLKPRRKKLREGKKRRLTYFQTCY